MGGRVALITGGSEGLGLGIAKALAGAGIEDIILVARTQSKLDDAKQAIELDSTAKVATYSMDLTSREPSDWDQLHRFVADTYGKLDYLVNNVGEFEQMKGELSAGQIAALKQRSHLLNAAAPDILSRAFRELLLAGTERKILDVLSQAVLFPFEDNTTYAATKASHMRSSIHKVVDTQGHIHTYRLYPGLVDTKAVAHFDAPKLGIQHVGDAAVDMLVHGHFTDLFLRHTGADVHREGYKFDYASYHDGERFHGHKLLDDAERAMVHTLRPALLRLMR